MTAASRRLIAALIAASTLPYLVAMLSWWRANAIGMVAFSLMMPLVAAAGCLLVRRDTASEPAEIADHDLARPSLALGAVSGGALAAAASALLVQQPILGALGLWLAAAAIPGWLGPPSAVTRYALPLSPLLLTAPLTSDWPARFEALLQRLSAATAELWLNLLGLPASREAGVVVVTPGFRNVVDDTCSGVDTFTALALYALLLGLLFRLPRGRLLIVMALTLPMALLANGARVAWISVLGERGGAELAMGTMHDVSGYVVFAIAYALLLLVLVVLHRRHRAPGERRARTG